MDVPSAIECSKISVEVWINLLVCLQAATGGNHILPPEKEGGLQGFSSLLEFSYLGPGRSINKKGKICRV